MLSFPNLGLNDVIFPGSKFLSFNIALTSTVVNRTIVQNMGIVKKTAIKISGNEVFSIDGQDVYYCYSDLWKTANEKLNSQYQGIDTNTTTRNATRLRVGTANGTATATNTPINTAFGNRFRILLYFELHESHMPFYQSALGDRLQYKLTFNAYNRVTIATGDAAVSYSIQNISLEYIAVTQPELARIIRTST